MQHVIRAPIGEQRRRKNPGKAGDGLVQVDGAKANVKRPRKRQSPGQRKPNSDDAKENVKQIVGAAPLISERLGGVTKPSTPVTIRIGANAVISS